MTEPSRRFLRHFVVIAGWIVLTFLASWLFVGGMSGLLSLQRMHLGSTTPS